MPAVTMKEVAARAGVTPTVVSRVLHNKATAIRVSEATAERVRQAARDMGYRVNVMARNFRERQTMMIAVLHGAATGWPQFNQGSRYLAALMDGIVDGAFAHGYSLTLCPKLFGGEPEDAMADGRFDGLIWYSTYPSGENRAMLERCSIPLVLIHTPASEFKGRFPSVVCDNDQGIGLAVEHLVGLGHRRIAFVADSSHAFGESFARREAFLRHLERHGLPLRDAVLDLRADRGGIDTYLQAGPRHTAVVADSDGLAAEFILRAPKAGVRIPDDLSVVGFDSTSYCDELRPSLTSVYQPLPAMGRQAVDLLVRTIAEEALPNPQVIFPCDLDVRGSTSRIPS